MNWLALIQNLVPVAITIAQQVHGARTGPQKLTTAATIIQTALGLAVAAGTLPITDVPPADLLHAHISNVVSSMKASGELPN